MKSQAEKLAEERYPLDDPRKNMFHDNMGQYDRREAFIAGYEARDSQPQGQPIRSKEEEKKEWVRWSQDSQSAPFREELKQKISDRREEYARQSPEVVDRLVEALREINNICGTVNFSSHIQMREAIEGAVELSDIALQMYNKSKVI